MSASIFSNPSGTCRPGEDHTPSWWNTAVDAARGRGGRLMATMLAAIWSCLYPASVARGPRTHGFRVPSPTTRRCVGEREREEGGRLEIPHVVAELSRCRSSSHRRPAHATAAPTGSSKSSAPWRPASARSARARSGSVPEFGNILNEYCSSDFLPRQFTSECTPRTP